MRELSLTVLATVLVFVGIEMSHRLAVYLSDAASGKLARGAIFMMLGLHAIRYLSVVIPPAALLAIMLTLGRLYRDSEITVLRACGYGPGVIYRPLFILVVPLAAGMAGLSLFVVPMCMELQSELQMKARQDAEIAIFQPGVFRSVFDGQHVIYVGDISSDGRELRQVFIQSKHPDGIALTVSERGHQEIDEETGARYLVLLDGNRYVGNPGFTELKSLRFERMSMLVEAAPPEVQIMRRESVPSAELWGSRDPRYIAELHTRMSGPVSMLVIAFIAPLVAHAKPRDGRYGRVVAAVLIYMIYTNFLGVGEAWLKKGLVPPALGLWWVHAGVLMLGLAVWVRLYGKGAGLSNLTANQLSSSS
jgi:lipopolysaccharide export system permease protein